MYISWYLAEFFLEWHIFQTKVVEKIKTHIVSSVTVYFRKLYRLWDTVEKIWYRLRGHTCQYDACALHVRLLRIPTLTIYNIYSFLHGNNGYVNAPHCYVYTNIARLGWYTGTYFPKKIPVLQLTCYVHKQATVSDCPWGPPSLLYNGYQVFSGGKAAGAWRWPLTPI